MVAELVEVAALGQGHRAGRLRQVARWGCAFLLGAALVAPGPARAASGEEILDPAALLLLEQQAIAAQPREQCFLFSEVVHSLTEQAGREIAAGQEEQAQATLRHADAVLGRMHTVLQMDAKRLKNAEMLMEHASRRLSDMVHVAGDQSRGAVQATLQKLNALHSELLEKVFAK